MSIPNYQDAPYYADIVLKDEQGKAYFNPIWMKWFRNLVGVLTNGGGGSNTIASKQAVMARLYTGW